MQQRSVDQLLRDICLRLRHFQPLPATLFIPSAPVTAEPCIIVALPFATVQHCTFQGRRCFQSLCRDVLGRESGQGTSAATSINFTTSA